MRGRLLGAHTIALVGCAALGACGGGGGGARTDGASTLPAPDPSTDGSNTASPEDGPAPPAPPAGPSAKYPAFAPDVPRVVDNGGHVITSPVVVTVTFGGDPNAATYESIGDTIGASPYWTTAMGEYGVSPAVSGEVNHVRVAAQPAIATGDDDDPIGEIETWLGKQLKDVATSHFPMPTDQSIYMLYLSGPLGQYFCDDDTDGYHQSITVAGKDIAYAVVNYCTGDPLYTPMEDVTSTATHEIAEASLDPVPDDVPNGWQGLDADHLSWELMQQFQDETADMCEYDVDNTGPFAPDLPFFVQRQWSNASAAAGRAPCVPAAGGPYFNVAALDATDTVAVDFGALGDDAPPPPLGPVSKGARVAVGATRKIELGLYSEAPTPPFSLDVIEVDWTDLTAMPMSPTSKPTLGLALDKTTGQNGDVATLSVTVDAAAPGGASLVVVRSWLGSEIHPMPILIGQNVAAPKPKTRMLRRVPRFDARRRAIAR